MTEAEKKICDAFLSRFNGERTSMRLRSVAIFPDFDGASADEKASYLEAAETLEEKGLVGLKWEKHREGERLKTLTCPNIEKLFAAAGTKDPKAEAAEIRAMIKPKISAFEKTASTANDDIASFLNYLADNYSSADVGRGIDMKAAEDFITLLEFLLKDKVSASLHPVPGLSSRALSVKLFSDSKRLEKILDLVNPLLSRAKKQGISVPGLSFLERSLPETFIAGKLIFEFSADGRGEKGQSSLTLSKVPPPIVNADGLIVGFPLSGVSKFAKIRPLESKENMSVLTIENKETFYALASSQSSYDCLLYAGGYVNRAAAALVKILAASGFSFYHAGDLDPDGILILQNIRELAEKPVTPVNMDAATFDRYLPHARTLGDTVLRQAARITGETKAIPGMAELLRRILETKKGVEQEVIEYGKL